MWLKLIKETNLLISRSTDILLNDTFLSHVFKVNTPISGKCNECSTQRTCPTCSPAASFCYLLHTVLRGLAIFVSFISGYPNYGKGKVVPVLRIFLN